MITERRYKSKPLESWAKGAELRRQYARELWTAKDRGELLLLGAGDIVSLPAGLGKYHLFGGMGPNFGRIVVDRALLDRVMEASDAKGYGSDCCTTLLATLGAMFLNVFDRSSKTGQEIKADFQLEWQGNCLAQGKTAQLWADHYNTPYFLVETPPTMAHEGYFVAQLNEAIEWMSRVTGREYHDEWLITAVKNEWRARHLWGQIITFQQTVPAPLDMKMLFAIMTVLWRSPRCRQETVDFLQLVRDEVEDRVRNQIAAMSTERCRLMHEGPDTYYLSELLTYPYRYGALYVAGSRVVNNGVWITQEDGTWVLGPTLEELGLEMKTREDALHVLALLGIAYRPGQCSGFQLDRRVDERVKVAQQWRGDAVVFNMDRGCRGNDIGHMEAILMLKKLGIPTMLYDGNAVNPREFDEAEYRARIDTLMESLGLGLLETPEAPSLEAVTA